MAGFLALVAEAAASDVLQENGLWAGSLVRNGVTFGWFVSGEENLSALKSAIGSEGAFLGERAGNSVPDFVIFVISDEIRDGPKLDRKAFSFLEESQIQDLERAGLGLLDCDSRVFATQEFQVVMFVTIGLHRANDASGARIGQCVDAVLGGKPPVPE